MLSRRTAGIRAVFFDLGYTLIEYNDCDWPRVHREGHMEGYDYLARSGCSLPDFDSFHSRLEELKTIVRPENPEALEEWQAADAPEQLFRELGLAGPIERSHEFIEVVYRSARKYMAVCDGGLETCEELKSRGYRMGVISNTMYPARLLDEDLKRFGLLPFFDVRVYSSAFGFRKPHPGIFAEASRQSGLKPHEIAYVGDRYRVDMLGALDAGMRPFLSYRENMSYPDPIPANISVLRTMPDLLNLL